MLQVFVRKKHTSPTIQLCILHKHLFTNIFHPSGHTSFYTDELWKRKITNLHQAIKNRMKIFSIRLKTHIEQKIKAAVELDTASCKIRLFSVANGRYSTEVSTVFGDFRSTVFWLKLNTNKPIGSVNVNKPFVCLRISHNSFENKKRNLVPVEVMCSECADSGYFFHGYSSCTVSIEQNSP